MRYKFEIIVSLSDKMALKSWEQHITGRIDSFEQFLRCHNIPAASIKTSGAEESLFIRISIPYFLIYGNILVSVFMCDILNGCMKSMSNRLASRSLAPNSDESLRVKVLHEIVIDFSWNRYALKGAKQCIYKFFYGTNSFY